MIEDSFRGWTTSLPSSLPAEETEKSFAIVRNLEDEGGKGFLMQSHNTLSSVKHKLVWYDLHFIIHKITVLKSAQAKFLRLGCKYSIVSGSCKLSESTRKDNPNTDCAIVMWSVILQTWASSTVILEMGTCGDQYIQRSENTFHSFLTPFSIKIRWQSLLKAPSRKETCALL